MMNDPTVIEASRVMSSRLMQEQGDVQDKITKAFRAIVCRTPSEKELRLLTDYYNKSLQTIIPEDAEKMLTVGEYPLTKNMDKKATAALMRVISTIYNLEESITKT
jgi:hypothetical protein